MTWPQAISGRFLTMVDYSFPRTRPVLDRVTLELVFLQVLPFSPVDIIPTMLHIRSQWPRGLRRRSAAARLLRLWFRILPGLWMSACCECCVLSGRGLCDGLIIRTEASYRLWSVVVCDLEISWMRKPCPTGGCRAKN